MTATPPPVVVIGVGNPWRRDDGAGPAVATAVRDQLHDRGWNIEVLVLDGESARLVEAWDGADLAIVVDAVRTGATPGTVHRIDVAGGACQLAGAAGGAAVVGAAGHGPSSHGLGVAQAVELAAVLHRLPRRLVLVGVGGADFGPGVGLTDAAAAGVERAAGLVLELIESHLAADVEERV